VSDVPERRRSRPPPAPTLGGLVFLLALVAALPAAILFILGPLAGRHPDTMPIVRLAFVILTPLLSFVALVLRHRPPVPEGNAAKAGGRLAQICAILWMLYVVLSMVFRGGPL
jgi:hypothetical protein